MTRSINFDVARLLQTIVRLRANVQGVALIEFAMVAPVLITLYLGGFQVMEAVSVQRKVTTTARSLADLSTQNTSISEDEMQDILSASAQIMAPYASSGGTYRVSMINVDGSGVATVAWSRSKTGNGQLAKDSPYVLPAGLKRTGLGIIVCDVTYTYKPIALFSLMGDIPFKEQIFMVPRGASTVTLRP